MQTIIHTSVQNLGQENSITFQNNSDLKQTDYIIKEWILYKISKQLYSPPQMPYLNRTVHIWDKLHQ